MTAATSQVRGDVLSRAIERGLRQRGMTGPRVAGLRRRHSAYSTSASIEDLDVTLTNGRRLRLKLKDARPEALLDGARTARPRFLYHPGREAGVYSRVLDRRALGTAAFYAAGPGGGGEHWLVLEDVEGVELYQVGELWVWEHVAAWLGGFHAQLAAHVDRLAGTVPLLRHDSDHFRRWPRRAVAFAADRTARRGLSWLSARYESVVALLSALPVTLVHGDFSASNVLVGAGSPPRVCPVDWELTARGPGLLDLAALTAGNWPVESRDAMERAYRRATGWPQTATTEFTRGLTACRLHLALQWLGWAPGWVPPPEHARDWLADALACARELSL